MTATGQPLLEVDRLCVEFGTGEDAVRAVDGLSFTVGEGESVALVGESGCGKTTTALAITRLLPPRGRIVSGSIRLCGEELTEMPARDFRQRRWTHASMVFQGAMNSLNPVLTVGAQLAEPIQLHEPSTTRREVDARVAELLDMVGINPERAALYPHQFSGGMRQRAVLAMALANRPKLVIGDEPTTGLDVMVQAQILNLIERLSEEFKLAFLLISHDLPVVAETCERAVVMYAGRPVEVGSIEQVFERPRHPYTRALIDAQPRLDAEPSAHVGIPGHAPDLADPPAGCRFHPRCPCALDICSERQPGERVFDGARVLCHAVSASGEAPPEPPDPLDPAVPVEDRGAA